ncbi:MAG TPA: hypothetical protein VL995_15925 [Cellvibrio sp.]|nr:hypothetical protein [Cellvibrio sp.]
MSIFIRALVLSAATSLVACGGGGGKSDPKPSSVASSNGLSSSAGLSSLPASSTPLSSLPASSSPTSTAQSSLPASSASSQTSSLGAVSVKIDGTINAVDELGDPVIIDPELITIEVHLLDQQDQALHSLTPVASSYNDEESLRFSADLRGDNSGTVAVTVSYPGYTSYSQKLDAENSIAVNAKLQAVTVQNVEVDEATSISGAVVEGFNIAVSADDDAQQRDSMKIQIPSSLLPEGTQSLDVAVRTFDPSNEEDKEFFPGAYADSDGNQLASVAFNFAEINTDAGEPLQKAMRKARQAKIAKAGGAHKVAADEKVIINRQIPVGSCRLLEQLGDSDASTAGFQVPVYTYNPNSGLWDLLGHGTIYSEAGEMVDESQTAFDCENTNFYLEILVTNDIFLSNWWNLDYPITFTQPTNYCARIQIKNSEGETLSGVTGYVWDENGDYDFSPVNFTTDSQGIAHIQIQQSAAETQATVYFYDVKSYGFVKQTIALSTNCAAPDVQVIELVRPAMCSVSGNISFKNGQPVEREFVYALGTQDVSEPGFDFANSDADGNYRLSLPCGRQYRMAPISLVMANLGDINSWLLTDTDGTLQADEQSDDGKSIVMKPIQLDFTKPLVQGYYSYETNEATVDFYSNYAAFPMTYSATVYSEDGKTNYGTLTGNVAVSGIGNEELAFFNMGRITVSIDLPEQPEGYEYQIKLDIADAFNNIWLDVPAAISIGTDDEEPIDDEPNP